MARNAHNVVEYRIYELPLDFPVLCLTGDSWRISDTPSNRLHFHNCLEIGFCHTDSGTITFEDGPVPFSAGDVFIIPRHLPHTTCSTKGCKSMWSYLFVDFDALAADVNVALAYYKALDDIEDEGKQSAKIAAKIFSRDLERIRAEYPRQCEAIESCLSRLRTLEEENCSNPDLPAGCFGQLMGELFAFREDLWAPTLYQMGVALGRFIYLADAAVDYRKDKKKKSYNPFLTMGMSEDWTAWEQYLVLAMGRCTEYFERLPLVQDKSILDNILYSGIWIQYRRRQGKEASTGGNP